MYQRRLPVFALLMSLGAASCAAVSAQPQLSEMIDFSRAFRLSHNLENQKNLIRCDRHLLDKLRQLDRSQVELKTQGQIKKPEIDAVMARRDKIVAYFERLTAQRGESEVLY